MFQPQDQIEVGEDGFKQYDGKRVGVSAAVASFSLHAE